MRVPGFRDLRFRLTWDGTRLPGEETELVLAFLSGRGQVHRVQRAADERGPTHGAPPRWSAAGCWVVPLTSVERERGELSVTVTYSLTPPLVAGLELRRAGIPLGKGGQAPTSLPARTGSRRANERLFEPPLRSVFAWFTSFEERSNDALLTELCAADGAGASDERAGLAKLVAACRVELMARLRRRAHLALLRGSLPWLCSTSQLRDLLGEQLAGVGAPVEGQLLKRALKQLSGRAVDALRLPPPPRPASRELLAGVRDLILHCEQVAWHSLSPEEIGARFAAFAQGRLRVNDRLHELNAEPDSSFYFLFAEFALSLAELEQDPAERLRWRRITRELVIGEHLFRRAYRPVPSLLVDDFASYCRANCDRDPKRRTSDEELDKLRAVYAALDPADEQHWRTIQDDHGLLVALACPGWLEPFADLSQRLDDELADVTVAADGPRDEDHAVRLFVRHMLSAFARLPHGALEGSRPLAEFGLVGEPLAQLCESLRGYVRRRSEGSQTLLVSELRELSVGELLRLVVARCRGPGQPAGDDGLPGDGTQGGDKQS